MKPVFYVIFTFVSQSGSGDPSLRSISCSHISVSNSSQQLHLSQPASTASATISSCHSCATPSAAASAAASPLPSAPSCLEPASAAHSTLQPSPSAPQPPTHGPCSQHGFFSAGPAAAHSGGHPFRDTLLLSTLMSLIFVTLQMKVIIIC